MTKQIKPYGEWTSPISGTVLTSVGVTLSQIEVGRDCIYWVEARPLEGGRGVIVRCMNNGATTDVTPPGFNARTRVHEYGGGAYFIHGDSIFFSNFVDQRLYRQDGLSLPRPITPAPDIPAGVRYADGRVTPDGRTIISVRERHQISGEPFNELVAIPSDGSSEPRIIASGQDFYAAPRIHPRGNQLAWISWKHPDMPWDATELWLADLAPDGRLTSMRKVAGGDRDSICQPEWSPAGVLHFASDRTGWWNLYALQEGDIVPLFPMNAEFAVPLWVFGVSRYAFLSKGRIVCAHSSDGIERLGIIDVAKRSLEPLSVPYDDFDDVRSDGDDMVFLIGGSASAAPEVAELNGRRLKQSMSVTFDAEDLSKPQPIEFPTSHGLTAFALFYPPANSKYTGPADRRPPLLVISHGGPTSATSTKLRLLLQYWTSRGFAVVDVNYGGSTGYGREYRERLNGQWGIVDVEDCINAARYLAERGDVDGTRMSIRGGSAGGFTTLCALVFSKVFAAGASHFGVADLAALARDTHKFESRYLERLVAPYPEKAELYRQRSPIHFADRLSCPIILFQGLDDKVVPPSQAETFITALRQKHVPFAYVAFAGEGHGFRKAENIRRAAEAELYFYSRVFEFQPAENITPVEIENL